MSEDALKKQKEFNPFATANKVADINQGVVSVESERAIADVKGKLLLARQFPRNEAQAYSNLMLACSRKIVAENAEYAYPRAGTTVSGPSIRLAEEAARCWGNIEFGIKELSRNSKSSEMEAVAWDLETNVRRFMHFTVPHTREKSGKTTELRSDRDIYEKVANEGARRVRACILAILPPELMEGALAECRKTLSGENTEPLSDRIKKFVSAFARLNVSKELIEKRLGYPSENMTDADIAEYRKIYNSIRDNLSTVGDWFDVGKATSEKAKQLNEKIAKGSQSDKDTNPDSIETAENENGN